MTSALRMSSFTSRGFNMYAVRGVKAMTRTIRKASQRIPLRVETILLPKDFPIATLFPPKEKEIWYKAASLYLRTREKARESFDLLAGPRVS